MLINAITLLYGVRDDYYLYINEHKRVDLNDVIENERHVHNH